eukprot:scaffold108068_cov63-Phaeocystis_antarctica.AAC.4
MRSIRRRCLLAAALQPDQLGKLRLALPDISRNFRELAHLLCVVLCALILLNFWGVFEDVIQRAMELHALVHRI